MVFPGYAQAKRNEKYASIVMDADTGMILHQRYADELRYPASITKVMTLMLVFDALKRGKIGLKDRIRVSKYAADMVPSKLGLSAGSSIRVQDAIYALVTKSANDVAVALAEHIGGTEEIFARMMTRKARVIGMHKTVFRNASGLHDPGQVSTARDIAIMANAVIKYYPEYYRVFSTKNFTYNGKSYRNHNRLMNTYAGMDGMKTGYINASGFNLVASAVQNDRRLIGVVFGGRSSYTRNTHMAKLLDEGFSKINTVRMAAAQIPVPPRKPTTVLALQNNQSQALEALWAKAGLYDGTGSFDAVFGQGDYDPSQIARIKTGLVAVSAHKIHQSGGRFKGAALSTYQPLQKNGRTWSVQLGAFESRRKTNVLLHNTKSVLPERYAYAVPVIAPFKTQNGWLFRARLNGLSKPDAYAVCGYVSNCIPVPPQIVQ